MVDKDLMNPGLEGGRNQEIADNARNDQETKVNNQFGRYLDGTKDMPVDAMKTMEGLYAKNDDPSIVAQGKGIEESVTRLIVDKKGGTKIS